MAATDELYARVDRLERDLLDLSGAVARAQRSGGSAMSRISLADWLKVSGPTFATLVFGFALLWNVQQTTSAQVLDVARGMGRLEGAVAGLERSLVKIDERLLGIDERLAGLDGGLARLGASIDRLAERIGPGRP
jgi:hypothetical protein